MRKLLRFHICTYFTFHFAVGIKSLYLARPPVNLLRDGDKEGGDMQMMELCQLPERVTCATQTLLCSAGGPRRCLWLLSIPSWMVGGWERGWWLQARGKEWSELSLLLLFTLHLPPAWGMSRCWRPSLWPFVFQHLLATVVVLSKYKWSAGI